MFFKKKRENIKDLSHEKIDREREDRFHNNEDYDIYRQEYETYEDFKRDIESNQESGLNLEEGDLPALILSAFIAFSPVFIVLIIILVLTFE